MDVFLIYYLWQWVSEFSTVIISYYENYSHNILLPFCDFAYTACMIQNTQLKQSCHDILVKNMGYTNQSVYLLYDIESPLAQMLSDAWIAVSEDIQQEQIRLSA